MKKILLSITILAAALAGRAQVDPHFSEYYVYPSWINPALTGAIDGDYRISAIYRNQWGSFANGFSTVGLSGDFVTDKNISFGGSILQQTAGNGGFTYLTAYGSIAYTGLKFGREGNQRVVFGLQGGLMQRRFNTSKFQMGDQWNPITGYNPSTVSTDVVATPRSSVFDAAAGIAYYDASPNKKANAFFGYSASHLTQPDDKFTTGPVKGRIPMRHTVHGGMKININESFSITPNGLYLRQGKSEEKMVGAYGQLRAADNLDVLLGANLRWNDAISPFAGFWYRNFTLGIAYDINNSDLGRMAGSTNSFELSISYTGRKNKELAGKNFVCPRL